VILLKSIPKIDKFINNKAFDRFSKEVITKISKKIIENLRKDILENKVDSINEDILIFQVIEDYNNLIKPSLQTVINATGIIVHTNLGRSLINKKSLEKAIEIATSYNNLEYDLIEGKRGERYSHIVKSLQNLTGCEDAIVVNNNASAVFLILNTFSKNKEVVVSRGELVEIGGSFRVPEVMAQSGAILKEIGTTNKTHLRDYENAINENTSMLMKVHKSNYSIEGFASEVDFEEIVKTAQQNNVIDYYDMGSGHMIDLPFNLSKKELISKIKKNQLLRMLRVDKITLSILEDNLNSYLKNELNDIPTLNMLFTSLETLEQRAHTLKEKIQDICNCEVISSETLIGGGTTPNRKIPSFGITISYKDFKPNKIEKLLRQNNLIARIENEKVLLDFRTIQEEQIEQIANIIAKVFN
jgi:L-seryl-tRNA(Ser) seleniumtransferase